MIDTSRGRPDRHDSLARTARFLTLVADGQPADQAARSARIGPWKALRLISSPELPGLLQALKTDTGTNTIAA